MSEIPLLSVIIPVYNVEKYLPQCLDSLLAQNYEAYELIVVNDGSTDSSGEIAEKYASKHDQITLIQQENSGVGQARNNGILHAEAKYIYFLDSDDFVVDNFFETLAQYLTGNSDILQFGFTRISESNKTLNSQTPPPLKLLTLGDEKPQLAKILNAGVGLAVWDKIIKKELLLANNVFFDDKKRGEDFTFNLKLFGCAKSLLSIEESLLYYRILFERPDKFDPYLVENHVDNFERVLRFFEFDYTSKEIKKFLIKIFSTWFFVVIPMNLAKTRKLTFKEKCGEFEKIATNPEISDFLASIKIDLSTFQKFMKKIIGANSSGSYILVGKVLSFARKLKYS